MRATSSFILILGLTSLGLTSCGASAFKAQTCTEIFCSDQFHATVTSASGAVPNGTHVLEVTADGTTTTCTFAVPLAMSAAGGVFPQCPSPLTVAILPAQSCTETETPTTKSQRCMPVPGHFSEQIGVLGAPVEVHVLLTVDGTVAVDQTTRPSYVASRPNGPGCDPICHQANVSWPFPETP